MEALGVREIALAASYHGARAATPLHPLHRLVEAPSSALYRPVRESAWRGQALRPVAASWVASTDPFAEAAMALTDHGFAVARLVDPGAFHYLGTQRPDLAVRNCFGDVYSYALCVSHDEVLAYIATLAGEAVREVPIAGVSIEGLGQLGVAHNGLHEKTDGAYGPAAARGAVRVLLRRLPEVLAGKGSGSGRGHRPAAGGAGSGAGRRLCRRCGDGRDPR